jgi:uncharacterized membrane protein YheB (UPF0754 family)
VTIYHFLLPPLVGAGIGYLTNRVAIWMLFHPYYEYRVLGVRIPFTPGLIPRKRQQIIESIANTVERELLTSRDVFAVFRDHHMEEHIRRAFDNVARNTLVARFVPPDVLERLKQVVLRDMMARVNGQIERLVDHLGDRVDVKALVLKRLEGVDFHDIERIVMSVAATQLRYIAYFGGLLGFLIGCAQIGMQYFF